MLHHVHARRVMALLALALIAGCAGGDPSSPDASVPTFDVDNALDPDTGDLVLYPSDAVYEGELDAPVARLMATDEASAMVSAMADQSVGPPIRIGVVQSSSSILLGSTADYTIRDKANGVLVMSGTNGTATVTLAAVPEVWVYLQVFCTNVAAVSARKAAAEALGYLTLTEFAP